MWKNKHHHSPNHFSKHSTTPAARQQLFACRIPLKYSVCQRTLLFDLWSQFLSVELTTAAGPSLHRLWRHVSIGIGQGVDCRFCFTDWFPLNPRQTRQLHINQSGFDTDTPTNLTKRKWIMAFVISWISLHSGNQRWQQQQQKQRIVFQRCHSRYASLGIGREIRRGTGISCSAESRVKQHTFIQLSPLSRFIRLGSLDVDYVSRCNPNAHSIRKHTFALGVARPSLQTGVDRRPLTDVVVFILISAYD